MKKQFEQLAGWFKTSAPEPGEFFEKDGATIRSYVKKGDRNWPVTLQRACSRPWTVSRVCVASSLSKAPLKRSMPPQPNSA